MRRKWWVDLDHPHLGLPHQSLISPLHSRSSPDHFRSFPPSVFFLSFRSHSFPSDDSFPFRSLSLLISLSHSLQIPTHWLLGLIISVTPPPSLAPFHPLLYCSSSSSSSPPLRPYHCSVRVGTDKMLLKSPPKSNEHKQDKTPRQHRPSITNSSSPPPNFTIFSL